MILFTFKESVEIDTAGPLSFVVNTVPHLRLFGAV